MGTIEMDIIDTINRIIANANSIHGDTFSTFETRDGAVSYKLIIKSEVRLPGEDPAFASIEMPSTNKINEAMNMEVMKALAQIDEGKINVTINMPTHTKGENNE